MSDPVKITAFSVTGLWGDTSITVPIVDNRLVIVGVNGLGKSTVLNLFYYFISRQWRKLLDYDFGSLSTTIGSKSLTISREELEGPDREALDHIARKNDFHSARLAHALDVLGRRPEIRHEFLELMRSVPLSRARSLITGLGLPLLTSDDLRLLYDQVVHSSSREPVTENLQTIDAYLNEHLQAQILYLPTYRRIEKDLNIVLPGLEDELRRYHDFKRRTRADTETAYVELVEFGMEDVNRSIQLRLAQQKETSRSELNSLAGSYLRDVLRGEGESYDPNLVARLTNEDVEDILNRVEERTLNDNDKTRLRSVIKTIREGGALGSSDQYVAHFFVKLVLARQKLREYEVPVARFVDVCNEYLEGKHLVYDDVNYTLSVIRNRKTIELAALSSGEKQIVSLFSQVYIGSADSYIIIIDEPELSLSVNWQRRLLPDLDGSGRCAVIAAVTHSPFIFDNDFDRYTVDLSEYVRVASNGLPRQT